MSMTYELEAYKDYMPGQKRFLKKNKIYRGDLLIPTREAYDYEGGWNNVWADGMEYYIGQEGVYTDAGHYGITLLFEDGTSFSYPWFVLEVSDNEDEDAGWWWDEY